MYFYLVENFQNATENVVKGQVDSVDSPVNGKTVVPVKDNISIDETSTSKGNNSNLFEYEDLLDQKYQGLLQNNSSYSFVEYDDLLDSSVWDTGYSSMRGGIGQKRHFLSKKGPASSSPVGALQTDSFDISSKGSFSQFAVYWDVYTLINQESDFWREQMYTHVDPDDIDVFISNDNGSNFVQATFMEDVKIGATGDQIVLRFENPDDSRRIYIGGLAFLF